MMRHIAQCELEDCACHGLVLPLEPAVPLVADQVQAHLATCDRPIASCWMCSIEFGLVPA